MRQKKRKPKLVTFTSNIERLIARLLALAIYPNGESPTAKEATEKLKQLSEDGKLGEMREAAIKRAEAMINLVRIAPDNPYGDNAEDIAGVIMANLDARTGKGE